MADEEMQDADSPQSHDTAESGSNESSDDSEAVEMLVSGRERRATAGNRMANLIEREEEDDVALLFAEVEDGEDNEFEEDVDENVSDAQLESSSDEDDNGPDARGDEDLEGEKELERQAKVERAKKRKAEMAFTTQRKKVKIDPSVPIKVPAPRPSKKKERDSWLPKGDSGPSRLSSRKQTMANREITHARLKDDEIRQVKVKAQAAKRAREREENLPKEMTQADRLAEAEKTEKKNARSLNKWEEMEKTRAADQAAKLKALHQKTLAGPVVSWWSGEAEWLGNKLVKVGNTGAAIEQGSETKKRGRKPKGYYDSLDIAKEIEADQSSLGTPREQTNTPAPSETMQQTPVPNEGMAPDSIPQLITFATPQGPDNFMLQGIHEYASLPPEVAPSTTTSSANPPAHPSQLYVKPVSQIAAPSQPPQIQLVAQKALRNLVRLKSFPNHYPPDRELGFLFQNKKPSKPLKQTQELCAITSLPAKYRDPITGLAYANSFAYKKLREINQHQFVWSSMLGCYAGAVSIVARGVPDGFLAT